MKKIKFLVISIAITFIVVMALIYNANNEIEKRRNSVLKSITGDVYPGRLDPKHPSGFILSTGEDDPIWIKAIRNDVPSFFVGGIRVVEPVIIKIEELFGKVVYYRPWDLFVVWGLGEMIGGALVWSMIVGSIVMIILWRIEKRKTKKGSSGKKLEHYPHQ